MNPPAASDYFDLHDYLGLLRRRWLTIAALACIGVAAAAGYVVLGPKQYTGTVLIQVNALPSNANAVGGRTGGPVNMDNEAQVVQSTAVTSVVKSAMHSPLRLADIAQNIKVVVPPNSTFLQISYTAPSAQAAQLWTNEVGRAYLYVRRVSTAAVIGSGIKALRAQETRLRATIERLKVLIYSARHKLRNAEGTPVQIDDELQLNSAQSAITAAQDHIDSAIPLYNGLTAPGSVIAGSIVTPATLPTAPSSPRKLLVLPSGLVAGLVLGLGLALLRDRRDRRLRSARDLERISGMPALLDLTASPKRPLATIEPPRSRAGQAFGELARHISAELGDGKHVIAVAATAQGPGGGAVAANLAAALARTSDKTVIICGDLSGTEIPALTGAGRGPGLSDVLTGSTPVAEVTGPAPGLLGLRVLGPGLDPPATLTALRYAAIRQLASDLLEDAGYVVIEVQSAGDGAGSFNLAELAETAIVVAEAGRSDQADVTSCLTRLERLHTPILGTVIVPARRGVPSGKAGLGAPARSDQVINRRREPEPDQEAAPGPPPALSPIAAAWTASTPAARGDAKEFTGATAARQVSETWPLPRMPGGDRDRYSDRADPGAAG